MSTFGTFDAAGSGLIVYRKWLDAVSDNIANINDVRSTSDEAFQARYVVAQAADYGNAGGVQVGRHRARQRQGPGRPRAGQPPGRQGRQRARAPTSTSPTRWAS